MKKKQHICKNISSTTASSVLLLFTFILYTLYIIEISFNVIRILHTVFMSTSALQKIQFGEDMV